MRSTDLTDADLRRSDLRRVDLSRAVIDGTNVQGAIYDANTQFPEGFDPAAAGAILTSEASADCPPLE